MDLANDLGRRLGVPVEIVAYDSVAAMGDAAPSGAWDIAFLGSDPAREKIMSFTAAYIELDATYLVPMVPQEAVLADDKIAAILTFVRSSFENNAPPVATEFVANVRKKFIDRKTGWTEAELNGWPAEAK